MGNNTVETNIATTQPDTEKNEIKEKIILNIDNNELKESYNSDNDNIININDKKTNPDNGNKSDEFDDFVNIDFIQEEPNQDNGEKIYIWIDPDIYNKQNEYYYNYLRKSKKIEIKRFKNIDESFYHIKENYNKYKEIIIIISGKLFYNFIKLFRKNIKEIQFSPTILIFTSKIELVTAQLKMNNMYYNNDLFNPKLIFTNPSDILDFINGNNIQSENDLTFDIIECAEQLIIPNYYSYILEDTYQHEIEYFNSYLIQNFPLNERNEDIHKLINQIKNKVLPKDILIQYWIRIYTLQSDFYGTFNNSLRTKNSKVLFYYPFIKLCYEELRKGFLESSNEILYRCSKISIKEFEEINRKFNSKYNEEKKIPNVIVFSRCFLSFSIERRIAEKFAKASDGDTYSILYIIEKIKNIENNGSNISNADIQKFSNFSNEKEILIFPFTCFEIVKIVKIINNPGNNNKKKIDYEIHLKYLGNYSHYIEDQFGNNFFDKIQISKFSEELINSGIVKAHNFISTWIKKKNLEIKLDKICFFLDGEEDCIGYLKNEIIVLNIISLKVKKVLCFEYEILNIIKLPSNKICSSFTDKTIRIIQFTDNNTNFIQLKTIKIYAKKILYLYDETILCLDYINTFIKYDINTKIASNFIQLFYEKNKILEIEKLNEEKIIYVIEKNKENKKRYVLKIDYIYSGKEKTEKHIEKKGCKKTIREDEENKLKFIDLVLFNDYILICFNSCIDIFKYKDEICNNIITFDHFDYEITKMLVLSSDRIILGFYDSIRRESILREHILRTIDLENNKNKFDCIGNSEFESFQIDNIIKIYEYKILMKTKNDSCIIYERKNEFSEKLKESLIDICITQEIKYDEIEKVKVKEIVKEEERNNPLNINLKSKNIINNNIKLLQINHNKNRDGIRNKSKEVKSDGVSEMNIC